MTDIVAVDFDAVIEAYAASLSMKPVDHIAPVVRRGDNLHPVSNYDLNGSFAHKAAPEPVDVEEIGRFLSRHPFIERYVFAPTVRQVLDQIPPGMLVEADYFHINDVMTYDDVDKNPLTAQGLHEVEVTLYRKK